MAKRHFFIALTLYCLTWISCQTVQNIGPSEIISPKRYNWHQRQLHPCFGITHQDSIKGTTIEMKFNTFEFSADNPTFLEVIAHGLIGDSAVMIAQRFVILDRPLGRDGIWKGEITLPAKVRFLKDMVVKFGPNGLADQFYLNWSLADCGWVTSEYIHTGIVPSGVPIHCDQKGRKIFAPLSDKLPSPPFSTNAPFIPEQLEEITKDTLLSKPGAFIFIGENVKNTHPILFAMNNEVHPQYPECVTTGEMSGPMRYLCSKEEFDKISKSTDGPENAMEKFWIQSAGSREKAKKLIKAYYQRVWDANHHFTSYAEGWKTDRGMIYLVFGHPEKIELENNIEIWSYTLETGQLQFAFELVKHPIWGEVYILKRNEQYRPHWEFQVSQWRQGRIFK